MCENVAHTVKVSLVLFVGSTYHILQVPQWPHQETLANTIVFPQIWPGGGV